MGVLDRPGTGGARPHGLCSWWEVPAGGNIPDWMEKRLDEADHVLCVVSPAYLTKDFSSWERHAGHWAAIGGRKNVVLPVFVEPCDPPKLLAPFKR